MKCKEIMKKLEEKYPLSFAESWDNSGLLAGRQEKEVHRIFVALDATDEVIDCAVSFQADMLITHHPLIFTALKQINDRNYIGNRLIRLIQNDISYYAMHTNFDVCGMADLSASYLKLSDTSVLEVTYEDANKKEGIGRVGMLPQPMTLEECAAYVKEKLQLSHVMLYGKKEQQVQNAAISTGSGKGMVDAAVLAGAQVLITGDIDYHTGIDAPAKGVAVIDAGHYGTEYIFIAHIKGVLEELFGSIQVGCMEISEPYSLI